GSAARARAEASLREEKGRHCRPFLYPRLQERRKPRVLDLLQPAEKLAAEAAPTGTREEARYWIVTRLRLSSELRSTSLLYGSMPASYGSSSTPSSMVLSEPVMRRFSR